MTDTRQGRWPELERNQIPSSVRGARRGPPGL